MTNIFDFSLIRHITLDGLANALWRGLISLSFLSLRLISLSSWLRLSRFWILDWGKAKMQGKLSPRNCRRRGESDCFNDA